MSDLPEALSIEVTTRCNLGCVNCFAHAADAPWGDLAGGTALALVKEGAALGFTRLSLTGGEPLLWPPLFEVLAEARALGYSFVLINTNGHLFDAKVCARLAEFGPLVEFSVTLNGTRGFHDEIRGEGSWDRAHRGIAAALDHGLRVQVYTVVAKPLLDRLPHFVDETFKDFPGLRGLYFIQLRGVDDGYYQTDGLKLDPEDFLTWVKMTGYLALLGRPVQFLENALASVTAQRMGFPWVAPSPEITRPGKIVAMADGTLALNHSSTKRLGPWTPGALGSVLGSDLYRFLTGENSEVCGPCRFHTWCRQGGKVRPSSRFHNVGDPAVPFCQKVLELVK